MKKIARKAAEKGYDVEEFRCASDEKSLDAVRIPELKTVLLDGTAPHSIDPVMPGIDEEIIDRIVASIIQSLEEKGMVEIRSNEIGELVMNALLKIDKVAYVRYASVYKNFTTMEDFKDFAAKLMEGEE